MVNREADIKAMVDNFPPSMQGGINFAKRHSTGCLVRQGNGSYARPHQMCFGGLAAMIIPKSEYIVSCIQDAHDRYKNMTEENKTFFLNYLMKDSPWADCFLEHDAEAAIKDGITYHRFDRSGNMVIGCLSAVREMWEPYSIKAINHFKSFVDAGVNPDFAWVVCQAMHDNGVDLSIKLASHTSGHASWSAETATTASVLNYLNHNPVGAYKENFSRTYPYYGVFALFGGDKTNTPKFNRWLLDNSSSTVEEDVDLAPWEKGLVSPKANSITLKPKDMVKEVVKLWKKFQKEFKEQLT